MFLSFSILCLLVASPLAASALAVDLGPESTENGTALAAITNVGDPIVGPGPGPVVIPSTTILLTTISTWTGSVSSTSIIQNDELCGVALACTDTIITDTIIDLVPTSSIKNNPTRARPASRYSVRTFSTSSPRPPTRSSTPSSTAVTAAASSENNQAIRQRKYLIGGIIGGLLMLGTLGVMLFIIIRRRRLRKHLRDSKFLVDPEMASSSPSESRRLVVPSAPPSPSRARDINMDQKTIVRRAELEGQVQIVENERAELQRRITVHGVDSPGDQYLNSLRARVRELERQRGLMWIGDAPPGYRQFDAVE
ncbi:hypothetical protein B0H11DRAFT_2134339 [Mycena galericulata]|nr:hypothetical protein B0H11DRAFT_2134339 [Mycena galericulata]